MKKIFKLMSKKLKEAVVSIKIPPYSQFDSLLIEASKS